jgi:adenine specific DNA methylase Mod
MNKLLFGDNLNWLRDAKVFPDTSVDLVYLDPPFNSNADYNVLFREASGESSQAQFHAFTDTWNWADAAKTYAEFVNNRPLLTAGKPETRQYKAVFFTGKSEIGLTSAVVVAIAAP